MRKSIVYLILILSLSATTVFADRNMMDIGRGNGMMIGYGIGEYLVLGIVGLLHFAIASFIFFSYFG